jgi:hypothetical protein
VEGKIANKTNQINSFGDFIGYSINTQATKKATKLNNSQRTRATSNDKKPRKKKAPITGGSQTALLSGNNNLI